MKSESFSLDLGDTTVVVPLYRKKIKYMHLRVRADGSVAASAPLKTSSLAVARFLDGEKEWLKKVLKKQRAKKERQKPFLPTDGAMIPILGVPHTLAFVKAPRFSYARENGVLTLFLREKDDAAARGFALRAFAAAETLALLSPRVEILARRFALSPAVKVKWLKTRWGSCMPAKNLVTLNAKLIFLSPELSDAVILHELCHFRVPDHSAKFYRELSRYLSDPEKLRRTLAAVPLPNIE